MNPPPSHLDALRRIAPLAWPVLIGQLAVLAFSTVDTILVGRHSAADLAAFAVGSAIYITCFIGLMGVILAIGPIAGQLHGAGRPIEAGESLRQTVWLALGLSAVGSPLLLAPGPLLALAGASPAQQELIRGYLRVLACSLPASLIFTAYRGFNIAISRPRAAMILQLGGLALKIPLSAALIDGIPVLGIPALGVTGCAIATLIAMWSQAGAAALVLLRDPFYAPYALAGRGLGRPEAQALRGLLRLGLPMGLSILVEVCGFTFMAILIARLGPTAVAGHQIAANLVALLFMMPLALSNAIATLVAQRIGAGDVGDARRLGSQGIRIVVAFAAVMGGAVLLNRERIVGIYTQDAAVRAAALPLLAWALAFHVSDALQTAAAFTLRAWRIATAPMLIYAFAVLLVGLGGGVVLGFDLLGVAPEPLRGASGFWCGASLGLALTGIALSLMLRLTRDDR